MKKPLWGIGFVGTDLMWWFSYLHTLHTGNHHVVVCLQNTFFFFFRNIMKYSTIFLLSTMHCHKFIVRVLKVLLQIHMHICHTQSYVIQWWTFFSIAKETLCRWDHTIMMIMATCLRGQEANFLSRPCHTFSLHLYILLLSLSGFGQPAARLFFVF